MAGDGQGYPHLLVLGAWHVSVSLPSGVSCPMQGGPSACVALWLGRSVGGGAKMPFVSPVRGYNWAALERSLVVEIPQLIDKSEALTEWIRNILHDIEVQGDIRSRLALGCLDLALEHREAIVLLISKKLYGSAFALLRSIFESYVRGIWLHRCAEEREVEKFTRDRLDKEFHELIQAIENIEDFSLGVLSRLKMQGWKAMNSYTHSGFQHVIRRMKADTLEPNYREEEILEALNCANALGLLSVLQVAFLSTSQQLPSIILEKTGVFIGNTGIDGVV